MAAARKPAAAMFSYVEDDDELFTDVQTFEKKTPAVTAKTAATEELTLLGTTALTLVGMKFYAKFRGTYNVGEVLRLERDPINPYDRNCVKVLNGNIQVGSLSAEQSKVVAPLMDQMSDKILLKPTVASYGNQGSRPLRTDIFAKSFQPLSTLEIAPLQDSVRHFLGHRFQKSIKTAPKPPPTQQVPERITPSPLAMASSDVASATPAAGTNMLQLLGKCALTIVGMRYDPAGSLRVGEQVLIEREPNNPYDSKAVRVDTLQGVKYGHIAKAEAAMLSELMDQHPGKFVVKGCINGHGSATAKPVSVSVYSSSLAPLTPVELEVKRLIVSGIFAYRFRSDTPISALQSLARSADSMFPEAQLSTVDWEGQQKALEEMFEEQSLKKIQELPQLEMPALLSKHHLFDHQRDGIRWLVAQEEEKTPAYFKKTADNRWQCDITKATMITAPPPVRGGILADDMGLGKTLQTIGLILSNPPSGHTYPIRKGKFDTSIPRTNLIVAPLSVLANWTVQIKKFANDGATKNTNLSVEIYHGPNRDRMLTLVKKGELDVLLASYQTLAADHRKWMENESKVGKDKENNDDDFEDLPKKKKRKTGPNIFDLEFHRIILDEAHLIRNSKTGIFKAASSLVASRKLCLTGTPFVNKPTDIHSLLKFLGVQPLADEKMFNSLIYDPIKNRHEIGLTRIRTTMAYIALRRDKKKVDADIKMAEKVVMHVKVPFPENSEHKLTYDVLYKTARAYFESLLHDEDTNAMMHFMEILALVLRIRQSCCHLALVPGDYRKRAAELLGSVKEGAGLGKEEGVTLLEHLQGQFKECSLVECAVCFNEMEEENAIILRECKHTFCEACLNQIRNQLCPMCRQPYTPDDMITKAVAKDSATKERFSIKDAKKHTMSPKIQALFSQIDQMKPDEKGVIFSQWTSMLDIIEMEMKAAGHTFTRIDGRMNAQERIDAMEAFDTEGCYEKRTPRFILCSLMACGTGINLTRGNVVFLMDPWWNGAAESQAMDRVHRIGQTRKVRVMRFLMKDSIEERLVGLQDSKAALGKGSMEKLTPEEKRKARLTALMDLFQIEPPEQEWLA